jgi:hypothetical protein
MKPDNVLIKADGSLCVCDFGEAVVVVRQCAGVQLAHRLTSSSSTLRRFRLPLSHAST